MQGKRLGNSLLKMNGKRETRPQIAPLHRTGWNWNSWLSTQVVDYCIINGQEGKRPMLNHTENLWRVGGEGMEFCREGEHCYN
jgi:hypothetical protein